MPSIVIKEKDRTVGQPLAFDDNVVLIPGKAYRNGSTFVEYTATHDGESYVVKEDAEFLFETAGALVDIIANKQESKMDEKFVSYWMAKRLLNLGMKVLYVVKETLNAVVESGDDSFFEKFKDRGLYDLRFITAGEFEVDTDLADEMIECASRRGDATALINVPDIEPVAGESGSSIYDDVKDIVAWCDSLNNTQFQVGDIFETPCKYAAAFAGFFTIDDERIKSGNAYKKCLYPAFFDYLASFAYYTHSYASWYSMSGSVRGKAPFAPITIVTGKFGDADINKLQTRISTASIQHKSCNVIANIRPYGNLVWGNRTLHPIEFDTETETTGLKASNFLNVRQLCSLLKKTVYRACRKFTFEPNTDTLWVRFSNEITTLLEKMKADQGIRGYKLIQEQTYEKATLKAIIRIIPIEAVEDFDITVELADSIEIGE